MHTHLHSHHSLASCRTRPAVSGGAGVPHHHQQLLQQSLASLHPAAAPLRSSIQCSAAAGGVDRQRRTRRTSSSSSTTQQQQQQQQAGDNDAGAAGSWQRRRPQARSRRRAPDDGGGEGGDGLEREFLDPEQASRLRKLIKQQGRDAVVDKRGFVRTSVLTQEPEAAEAGAAGAKSGAGRRSQEQLPEAAADGADAPAAHDTAAAAAAAPPAAAPAAAGGRTRLFDASQLQPAARGSGGTAPVLPIVRPSSSTAAVSSSSPTRPSAPHSSRGRGGSSSAAGGFHSGSSWQQLGATQDVIDALSALGISRPSHVQAEAYAALSPKSGFRHVALADQAGSGKTLAYLLPLLQQLKAREAAQGGGPVTQPNSASIVVVTPTTELAQQVGRVVRALSQAGLRVRSAIMTGGQADADKRSKTFRTQCELLAGGVDVLIATPGRLVAHADRGSLSLAGTAALVLDEVDVLAGGEGSYEDLIAPLRAGAPPSLRCVLVSATLPQHTFDELQELFVGLGAAFGPGLHRTATGVVEELIDCSGGDDVSLETGTQRKLDALFASLERIRSPRTVVFCNKIETCRVVENALKRQGSGMQVLAYHEAIRDEVRAAALNTWLAAPQAGAAPSVLVCTDRTSRGIDSMWCGHVVLFEFPRDPSEYVRRVGRTARGAGGTGVVSVLVLGKQVPLAQDILSRNREGAPVHRVPRLWSEE